MWAARVLLGWSRDRLAAQAGTTRAFVWIYENGGRVMTMFSRERSLDGLAAIRAALEEAGVEFTTGDPPGVQLRRPETP
ncbi:MAG: XRE family transcriptional regulator [Oxalobacteraceae bacterium]|nr:MAG: XRE family transcriptional regulator [Oxalobacteraceae bacterium]